MEQRAAIKFSVKLKETATETKNAVFSDMAQCRYFVNLRFAGKYRLHLQGIRNPRAMNQRVQVAGCLWLAFSLQLLAQAGSSLLDFLYPENGGETFLRNVG
jgi:hypothetical protein